MHIGGDEDDEYQLDENDPDDVAAAEAQLRQAGMQEEADEVSDHLAELMEAREQGTAPWQVIDWLSGIGGDAFYTMMDAMTSDEVINAIAHIAENERATAIWQSFEAAGQGKRLVDLILLTHQEIGQHQKIPHGLAPVPEPPTRSPLARAAINEEIDEIFELPDAERMSNKMQNRLRYLFELREGTTPIRGALGPGEVHR